MSSQDFAEEMEILSDIIFFRNRELPSAGMYYNAPTLVLSVWIQYKDFFAARKSLEKFRYRISRYSWKKKNF